MYSLSTFRSNIPIRVKRFTTNFWHKLSSRQLFSHCQLLCILLYINNIFFCWRYYTHRILSIRSIIIINVHYSHRCVMHQFVLFSSLIFVWFLLFLFSHSYISNQCIFQCIESFKSSRNRDEEKSTKINSKDSMTRR